ncbi:MAG: hypothetical protein HYT62_05345 [Candidatus Yanofskybacteria bacterium]|nr:hypothetical protein [Candidatus Yanofskybacteria bacterium]
MNRVKSSMRYIVPALGFLLPVIALAALANPSPVLSGGAVTLTEVEKLINGIARFLIVISIVIAVIFIVYGGIRWIAAGSNEEQVTKAKSIVWNGIIGALVVLAVGVILQTLAGVVTRSFFGTFRQ